MKLYIFVLVNLLTLCAAGLYDSNSIGGSNSGYSYGISQHVGGQQGVGQKYTDIIHSAPKPAYGGGSDAIADISTYKIIHENGGGSSGPSYGGYEGSGLSHGYSIPYGTLLSDGNNDHENYKVIRVIHEYSGRNGHSSNGNYGGYRHGGKGKATKTIKVIHDYASSKGFGGHHSGDNGIGNSKTIKVIHEKGAPTFEGSLGSYMPHDHLNEYNGGSSTGGFPNALETVKSLKTIGAFSNLGFPGIGLSASPAEHLPLVHENYPPVPAPNWKH